MSNEWEYSDLIPPSRINGGNKYTQNDALSLDAINAIVENSFYAANKASTSLNFVTLSNSSGTLTDEQYTNIITNNYMIFYDNAIYVKTIDNGETVDFFSTKETNTISNGSQVITKYYIRITKSTKIYSCTSAEFINVYNKSQVDTLLGNKQNTSNAVTTDTAQTITGQKTFSASPITNNGADLGASNSRWKDLYLAGNLSDGTNSISIANVVGKSTVSVSDSGTATDEVQYITINGVENKLAGGSQVTFVRWS